MTVPSVVSPVGHVIDMPAWSTIIRRAGSTLLVVTVVPMALFYLFMSLFGLAAAVGSSLAWYYGGMLVNIIRGRPVLAAALVGAGFLSIRAGVMFLTGNEVVYFLQPVGATLITATVFAVPHSR